MSKTGTTITMYLEQKSCNQMVGCLTSRFFGPAKRSGPRLGINLIEYMLQAEKPNIRRLSERTKLAQARKI